MASELRSDKWSNAHLAVNEHLTKLLNSVRDAGYNPSNHISYDGHEHRLTLDEDLLRRHPRVHTSYQQYLDACNARDEALGEIQSAPKINLGF